MGLVLVVVAVIVIGLSFYAVAGGAKHKDDSAGAGPGHDGGLSGGAD